MTSDTRDNTGLRSEKVRNLIGEIPVSLMVAGYVIIILIFVVLILAVTLIPYPYGNGETILQHII